MNTLEAALKYALRGWRVVPIMPGDKRPALNAWQDLATTNAETITQWFSQQYAGHGVGIATGETSGIWVLDVDDRDSLHDLEATHGKLPQTLTSITGSGGEHQVYRWPQDGRTIRNSASGILPGLDVRGEGGQIVAPPTVHPNGRPYEWEFEEVLAYAPEWLLDLVCESDVLEPPRSKMRTVSASDRPGDLWAAATDWAEILGARGWQLHHVDRQGERHWTRPGKEIRDGTSATTGYTPADTMKVFTSSVLQLKTEETYSKLGFLAAMDHGGDFSAAAQALADQGWSRPPERQPQVEVERQALSDAQPLPVWPVDALPAWMRDQVDAAADRLQVPVDLLAQLGIGALASVCMGHATVEFATWSENLNLYLYCSMHSGAGKSPAEKAMVSPLRKWEQGRRQDRAEDHAMECAIWKTTQAKKKKWDESVAMGSKQQDDPEWRELVLKAAEPRPMPFRLTVDDATPERLVQLLGMHKNLAMISTEAGLLDMVGGQGRSGSSVNIDVYLKAWSGETIQRDRKGGDDGPESTIVENALLSVVLTVQPSVIAKYQTSNVELSGRGFFARFMPSVPASLVGTRTFGSAAVPGVEAETYSERLTALADTLASATGLVLRPDPEAAQMFYSWCEEMEVELKVGRRLATLHDASSKIRSCTMRVAALLSLADSEWKTISAEVMGRALQIGDYWTEHAVSVAGGSEDVDSRHAEEMARVIIEFARKHGVLDLTPREVYLSRRRGLGLRSVEELVPGFERLAARGWLTFTEGSLEEIGINRARVRARLDPLTVDSFTESGEPTTASVLTRAKIRYPKERISSSSSSLGVDTPSEPINGFLRALNETEPTEPDGETFAAELGF